MTGNTPEEAAIIVAINKPSNASSATLTLGVYDADFSDEGELIINGNPAIKLFGSAGAGANDGKATNATFSTPASYWRDGNNTLLFRHTRTGGYVIDEVIVQFDVDTSSSNTEPAVTQAVVSPGSLPLDMTGNTPEEATINVDITNKPSNASNATLTLGVYDADFSNEGELIINGNPAIKLFGSAGVSANDGKTTNATFSTPASYWRNGNNTLLFRHTSTGGYEINEVTVKFDVGSSGNQSGSGSASLSWSAPSQRADNTSLSLSEIKGYNIYYGTSKGNYTESVSINSATATSATITDLSQGTYYMVITTRDTAGRESGHSSSATVQAK